MNSNALCCSDITCKIFSQKGRGGVRKEEIVPAVVSLLIEKYNESQIFKFQ